MNFFKKSILFIAISIGFNPLSFAQDAQKELSQTDKDELRKFADQLIGSLDPNMSPEERNKLVDQTVSETIQMDSYIKSLPEAERKSLEKEIEDSVSYLLNNESPVKELFDDKAKQETPLSSDSTQDNKEVDDKVEETEKKETVTISKDAKELKETLDNIITRLSSFLIKVKSMPRVSSEKEVEEKWNKLKKSLILFESSLKVVVKKDKLLNDLTLNDNKQLKDELVKFKSSFSQKEISFKVPDTAGLTIVYDDEQDDNVEFQTAQKQFKDIIDLIDKPIGQIIKKLSEFLESNAPEELTQDADLQKGLQQVSTSNVSKTNKNKQN